eukprot:gene6265-6984_t
MADDERSTERRINLAALRKQDASVDSILDTASSVAHYRFDAADEKWEKTEFEGSMFLYNRVGPEVKVAFLIMNRLNKENLIVEIKPGMEFKLQEPFLLCRRASEIIGIWFYDLQECSRLSSLLSSIAEACGSQENLANLVKKLKSDNDRRGAPKKDLMQMFIQAKKEYDKREKGASNFRKSASMNKLQSKDPKVPTILKRRNSFTEVPEHATENSDENGGITMTADVPNTVNTADIANTADKANSLKSDMLMRLLTAKDKTERKSRSRTLSYGERAVDVARTTELLSFINGQASSSSAGDLFLPLSTSRADKVATTTATTDADTPKPINVAMLEATVLLNSPKSEKLLASPSRPNDVVRAQRKLDMAKSEAGRNSARKNDVTSGDINEPTRLLAVTTATAVTANLVTPAGMASAKTMAGSKPTTAKTGVGRGRGLISILNSTEKRSTEQMPPSSSTTVQQADSPSKSTTPRKESGLAMRFPEPPSSGLLGSLMSPMHFKAAGQKSTTQTPVKDTNSNNSNTTTSATATTTEPTQLSKQQFQDALINLLQNDDAFVEKLHSSYLDVVSR